MNTYQQRGAALIVALIMLLISTVIGLAAVRSATLSERMSGNMYDRSLAYQAAEAALRAGEAELDLSTLTVQDCTDVNVVCPPVPGNTFNLTNSAGWTTVSGEFVVNSDLVPTSPQFYIEEMGSKGGTDEFDLTNSANCANYGACDESPPTATVYRITGRSVIRAEDSAGRSVVALQITVNKNL